jgi:hypothetical protein
MMKMMNIRGQTSMPSTGFKPTVSASKRSIKAYASEPAAIGTGKRPINVCQSTENGVSYQNVVYMK